MVVPIVPLSEFPFNDPSHPGPYGGFAPQPTGWRPYAQNLGLPAISDVTFNSQRADWGYGGVEPELAGAGVLA